MIQQNITAAKPQANGETASTMPTDWQELAERVLAGHQVTFDEALSILRSPDEELLDLMAAAYRVRRRYFGNRVALYFLMNAKSGLLSRGLRLLLAVEGFGGGDSALQHLVGAETARWAAPRGGRTPGQEPIASSFPLAGRPSARSTPSRGSSPKSSSNTICKSAPSPRASLTPGASPTAWGELRRR